MIYLARNKRSQTPGMAERALVASSIIASDQLTSRIPLTFSAAIHFPRYSERLEQTLLQQWIYTCILHNSSGLLLATRNTSPIRENFRTYFTRPTRGLHQCHAAADPRWCKRHSRHFWPAHTDHRYINERLSCNSTLLSPDFQPTPQS